MTDMIGTLPATNELTAIAERASLYEMLVAAMKRPRKPQPLPAWLYADIGLQPSQEREIVRRGR